MEVAYSYSPLREDYTVASIMENQQNRIVKMTVNSTGLLKLGEPQRVQTTTGVWLNKPLRNKKRKHQAIYASMGVDIVFTANEPDGYHV